MRTHSSSSTNGIEGPSTRSAGESASRFALLWFGEGTSLVGVAATSILLPLVAALELGAGPVGVGLLSAAIWLPWLLIGLPAGAWVDRCRPRTVMISADLLSAAALATVPLAAWRGVLTLPHLIAVAFATGVATVFFRPAYTKLVPQLVDDAGLDRANARLIGTESAAQVVGPGVAGKVTALVGPALGLAVGALTFLVSAVCLWRIHVPRSAAAPVDKPRALGEQVREGLRFVLRDRYLRWLMIIGGLSNFGLTGYGAILVLYLVEDLSLTGSEVGTYYLVAAVGGLFGSIVAMPLARRLGTARASVILLLASPAAVLVGLPTDRAHAWISVLGLTLVGVCVVAGNVVRAGWRQRYVPGPLLGRALTAMAMVNFGTMPVAGLASGWLGRSIGIRETILVMVAVHVVACWLVLASPLRSGRDLPLSPDDNADE